MKYGTAEGNRIIYTSNELLMTTKISLNLELLLNALENFRNFLMAHN